jgi:hypothetical protein
MLTIVDQFNSNPKTQVLAVQNRQIYDQMGDNVAR